MPPAKKNPNQCKHRPPGKKRCKNPAKREGYCLVHYKMHKQTGPKTKEGKEVVAKNGAEANFTLGMYAKRYATPEMIELLKEAQTERGKLNQELDNARMMLGLCMKELYARQTGTSDGYEDEGILIDRQGVQRIRVNELGEPDENGAEFIVSDTKRTQRRSRISDWELHRRADMWTARIASLTGKIAELQSGALPTDNPYEAAQQMSDAIREMVQLTNGGINQPPPSNPTNGNGNGKPPNGNGKE